jgi:hypothetical protein
LQVDVAAAKQILDRVVDRLCEQSIADDELPALLLLGDQLAVISGVAAQGWSWIGVKHQECLRREVDRGNREIQREAKNERESLAGQRAYQAGRRAGKAGQLRAGADG